MTSARRWLQPGASSLVARTVLANFVPVAVSAVCIFALMAVLFLAYLRNAVLLRQQSAESLAQLLAQQCAAPALFGDRRELERIALAMGKVEKVVFVSVLPSGDVPPVHVILGMPAGSDGEADTRASIHAALADIRHVEAEARITSTAGRDVVYWEPPGAADLGVVRVGLSTDDEERLSERALWNGVPLGLAVLGLIWLVQRRQMRAALAPLKNLTAVTERLAAGDLSQRAEIERADEVGELARAFNDMARELEIANERSRRALAAAEESSRLKSQFLANMSHEIRTPMNGIIGMTHLALETDLTEEQRGYLETSLASAEALLGLLNDFLDFSRIEAGKLRIEHSPFHLWQMVIECVRSFNHSARQKGLTLTFELGPGVPSEVVGDQGRVRQVLSNLLSNALKFTNAGHISVDLALVEAAPGRATVRFAVADTGIGIPPNKHASIFEPFSQVDGSLTRGHGGCGLGLAICAQLVELMHGTIGVESVPGQGSRFHFTVEFALPGGPAPHPEAGAAEAASRR